MIHSLRIFFFGFRTKLTNRSDTREIIASYRSDLKVFYFVEELFLFGKPDRVCMIILYFFRKAQVKINWYI